MALVIPLVWKGRMLKGRIRGLWLALRAEGKSFFFLNSNKPILSLPVFDDHLFTDEKLAKVSAWRGARGTVRIVSVDSRDSVAYKSLRDNRIRTPGNRAQYTGGGFTGPGGLLSDERKQWPCSTDSQQETGGDLLSECFWGGQDPLPRRLFQQVWRIERSL
jgi:hypothetical protein